MTTKKDSTKKNSGSKTSHRADSAFWRDLESRFRELQPKDGNGLWAEWDSLDRRWELHGTPSADVRQRFEQNAEYAAKVGFNRRSAKSFHSWLELLKRETDTFHTRGNLDVVKQKGKVRRGKHGRIERVWEVSATYCERLANEAYAEELQIAQAAKTQEEAEIIETPAATDQLPLGREARNSTGRKPDEAIVKRDNTIVALRISYAKHKGKDQARRIARALDEQNIAPPKDFGLPTFMACLNDRERRKATYKLFSRARART